MRCEVLLEFPLALDIIAHEVLLVGVIHRDRSQEVEDNTATDVEGDWVLLNVVCEALESRHY